MMMNVLATNYVPQNDRIWKELPPTVTFFALPPQSRNISSPSSPLSSEIASTNTNHVENPSKHYNVPTAETIATTTNQISNSNPNTSALIPLTWPNAIQEFDNEIRFAIHYKVHHDAWVKEQESLRQNNNATTSDSKLLTSLPTISNNITNIQQNENPCDMINIYVQTFQTLLRAERRELLIRYEQYTQYNHPIKIHYDNQHDRKGEPHSFVTIHIEGIADSKPVPQPNDLLLLRPPCYLSLPIKMMLNGSHDHPTHSAIEDTTLQWTPKCHIVDIVSTITQVTRGTTGTSMNRHHNNTTNKYSGDCITATWLGSEENRIMRESYLDLQQQYRENYSTTFPHNQDSDNDNDKVFTIRILPNKKEFERTMISLLWLLNNCCLTENEDVNRSPNTLSVESSQSWSKSSVFLTSLLFPKHNQQTMDSPISKEVINCANNNTREQPATLPSSLNFHQSSPTLLSSQQHYHQQQQKNTSLFQTASSSLSLSSLNYEQASFVRAVLARTFWNTCKIETNERIRIPIILTGPAGTGKTKTLLYAIMELIKMNKHRQQEDNEQQPHYRILICTPSHTACNVITQRLIQTGFFHKNELLRLLDVDRNISTIPIQIQSYCNLDPITNTVTIPSLYELMKYTVIVTTCIDSHILYQMGCTNQQIRIKRTKLFSMISEECTKLHMTKIFLNNGRSATPFSTSLSAEDVVHEPHFTHLFIDEAAQATEPETIIPFSVVVDPYSGENTTSSGSRTKNAISSPTDNGLQTGSDCVSRRMNVDIGLIGDPYQLSPMIYSNEAAYAGLDHSLMERLLLQRQQRSSNSFSNETITNKTNGNIPHSTNNQGTSSSNLMMFGPDLIHMNDWLQYSFEQSTGCVDNVPQGGSLSSLSTIFLNLNYRGHPSFLMLPSSLFYSDKLLRAGYTGTATNDGNNNNDSMNDSSSILTEQYWCQKLRMIEALSLPVVGNSPTKHKQQQKQAEPQHTNSLQQPAQSRNDVDHAGNNQINATKNKFKIKKTINTPKNKEIKKNDSSINNITQKNELNNTKTVTQKNELTTKNNENKYANNLDTTSVQQQHYLKQCKQWNWPIHFRGVVGKDCCYKIKSTASSSTSADGTSPNNSVTSANTNIAFSIESWCNHEEAAVVLEIVQELVYPAGVGQVGVSTNKIGVIAPFRGQVQLIRTILRANRLGTIDVGTVEDYQSMERDVIILSLTRSSLTFLRHDNNHRIGLFSTSSERSNNNNIKNSMTTNHKQQLKRCNVALTRAQHLFVLVGNPNLMIHDVLWKQFLFFCYRNGLWNGESLSDHDNDDLKSIYNVPCVTNHQNPIADSDLPSPDENEKNEENDEPSKIKNKIQIVNSYDILNTTGNNSYHNATTTTITDQEKDGNSNNPIVVVVSTLERKLRQYR